MATRDEFQKWAEENDADLRRMTRKFGEDCTQEAYIRCLYQVDNNPRFEVGNVTRPYFYTAARSAYYDQRRKQGRKKRGIEVPFEEWGGAGDDGIEDEVINRDLLNEALASLDELGARFSRSGRPAGKVLLLSAMGYTDAEIAQLFGCSVSAAKSQRLYLRKRMCA